MTRFIRPLGTTLMISSLTAALLAQGAAPKLNIKMGLWELTSTMAMTGDMPIDTSKMTPDQIASMKAAMASMAAKPTVTKSCMSKEKFNQGLFGDQKANCTATFLTNTPSVIEIQATCDDGKTKSVVTAHIEAVSTETIKGTMKTTTTANAKTMTMGGTTTGKWVAADCGTVK